MAFAALVASAIASAAPPARAVMAKSPRPVS
jgi:hypothetical protein